VAVSFIVQETGVHENQKSATSPWQTSHNVVSSTSHHERNSNYKH